MRISARQVIRQHKRYLGVVLAIALGTAGFIVIVTMGREVKTNLNKDLDLLGGATIVKVYFQEGATSEDQLERPKWFRDRTMQAMRRIPGATAASLISRYRGETTWGDRNMDYIMYGVDEFFWEVNGVTAKSGRLFGPDAVKGRRNVCVLGEELAKRIFGHTDVVGEHFPINNSLFLITGILDAGNVQDRAQFAYIPLTTEMDRIQSWLLPKRAYVRCATWDDVEKVAAVLPKVVEEQQGAEGLIVEVAREQLKHVKRIVWWVELFIYFSVSATLILGGFGIWNGMMTAVKSRTREIGLKKAMGAEDMDIMVQFLAESVCLSFGAAILGIGLGVLGVEVVKRLLSTIPPRDLFYLYSAVSLGFSLLLGIGAGFYPSLRAARMEVVSAIRYE